MRQLVNLKLAPCDVSQKSTQKGVGEKRVTFPTSSAGSERVCGTTCRILHGHHTSLDEEGAAASPLYFLVKSAALFDPLFSKRECAFFFLGQPQKTGATPRG